MKKIGIVGSRRRNTSWDYKECFDIFNEVYEHGDMLVSGGCSKGGDRFAEQIAKTKGLSITIHFPDWNGRGRSAGFQRNTQIANDCDVLIAVVTTDRTGGTEDTIKKCEFLRKKVHLV